MKNLLINQNSSLSFRSQSRQSAMGLLVCSHHFVPELKVKSKIVVSLAISVVDVVVFTIIDPKTHTDRIVVVQENRPDVTKDCQYQKYACVHGNKENWKASGEVSRHDDFEHVSSIPREARGGPTGVMIKVAMVVQPTGVPQAVSPIEGCVAHNEK